ncbi:hypothetical protein [Alterisphingorhabdus coralli]|uniref:Uncharacterized protein n=1 Tax=Alterisphingorhabdus coralli TaxID=3071408 RepID=A0AA97F693_9SPHN|nr:hypothetical protein [Parasphingorhabdus sp. SCSIO 66989]WOE74063.1 hypothetical protein RB602_09340 [Parasphingorhabdus sp. SCSIO 66989]
MTISAPLFFDPADAPLPLSEDSDPAIAAFLQKAADQPLAVHIPNAQGIDLRAIRHGPHLLPVTISHSGMGGSYVVQPHSAYVGYAKDELHEAGLGMAAPLVGAGLSAIGGLLRAANINRVAMLDNFLFATNLHGNWQGEGIAAMREAVLADYADHMLAIRSVDDWSSPALYQALNDDGWLMIPSRQIWVIDDVAAQWRPRSHTKSDRRKFRKSGLVAEGISVMTPGDAERIAALYKALYLDKYSMLNPQFTPEWIRLLSTSGLVDFQVVRDREGTIMGVAGCFARGDVLTVPVLGYDMTAPREAALYRIASLLFGDYAIEHNLRLNCSAGAGSFKAARGARSHIEYMACYIAHLPKTRQMAMRAMACGMREIAMPALVKRGL